MCKYKGEGEVRERGTTYPNDPSGTNHIRTRTRHQKAKLPPLTALDEHAPRPARGLYDNDARQALHPHEHGRAEPQPLPPEERRVLDPRDVVRRRPEVEREEQEERVHGELEEGQERRERGEEEADGGVDERVRCFEERVQEESRWGERGECEWEVEDDLGDGGEPGLGRRSALFRTLDEYTAKVGPTLQS